MKTIGLKTFGEKIRALSDEHYAIYSQIMHIFSGKAMEGLVIEGSHWPKLVINIFTPPEKFEPLDLVLAFIYRDRSLVLFPAKRTELYSRDDTPNNFFMLHEMVNNSCLHHVCNVTMQNSLHVANYIRAILETPIIHVGINFQRIAGVESIPFDVMEKNEAGDPILQVGEREAIFSKEPPIEKPTTPPEHITEFYRIAPMAIYRMDAKHDDSIIAFTTLNVAQEFCKNVIDSGGWASMGYGTSIKSNDAFYPMGTSQTPQAATAMLSASTGIEISPFLDCTYYQIDFDYSACVKSNLAVKVVDATEAGDKILPHQETKSEEKHPVVLEESKMDDSSEGEIVRKIWDVLPCVWYKTANSTDTRYFTIYETAGAFVKSLPDQKPAIEYAVREDCILVNGVYPNNCMAARALSEISGVAVEASLGRVKVIKTFAIKDGISRPYPNVESYVKVVPFENDPETIEYQIGPVAVKLTYPLTTVGFMSLDEANEFLKQNQDYMLRYCIRSIREDASFKIEGFYDKAVNAFTAISAVLGQEFKVNLNTVVLYYLDMDRGFSEQNLHPNDLTLGQFTEKDIALKTELPKLKDPEKWDVIPCIRRKKDGQDHNTFFTTHEDALVYQKACADPVNIEYAVRQHDGSMMVVQDYYGSNYMAYRALSEKIGLGVECRLGRSVVFKTYAHGKVGNEILYPNQIANIKVVPFEVDENTDEYQIGPVAIKYGDGLEIIGFLNDQEASEFLSEHQDYSLRYCIRAISRRGVYRASALYTKPEEAFTGLSLVLGIIVERVDYTLSLKFPPDSTKYVASHVDQSNLTFKQSPEVIVTNDSIPVPTTGTGPNGPVNTGLKENAGLELLKGRLSEVSNININQSVSELKPLLNLEKDVILVVQPVVVNLKDNTCSIYGFEVDAIKALGEMRESGTESVLQYGLYRIDDDGLSKHVMDFPSHIKAAIVVSEVLSAGLGTAIRVPICKDKYSLEVKVKDKAVYW